ncbi:MAG TPA: hypothetical protein VN890_04815 [Methylocella sp.]|nr:hypothetical protein [Methylocella sp.]
MKLAYAMTRRQFGKVITPLKVHSARLPPSFGDDVRETYEATIWGYAENDPIRPIVIQAVIDIETICRPVLET